MCKFVFFFFFNESKFQDTNRLRLAQMAFLPLYSVTGSPRNTWKFPALVLSLQLGCFGCPNGPALWSSWALVIGGLVPSPTIGYSGTRPQEQAAARTETEDLFGHLVTVSSPGDLTPSSLA